MKVKEHYDNHLANFYSWMVGGFDQKRIEFQKFLENNSIFPNDTKVALDLGAGHGIQSIALCKLGFDVTAVDFNEQLLNELKSHPEGKSIKTILADITNMTRYNKLKPELITCCGDTLTHLDDKEAIKKFLRDCKATLSSSGKLILSFRDYAIELKDEQRFIPIKNDDNRIFTCFLEYKPDKVNVTDILYEKTDNGWNQKVSSYKKVRISTNEVLNYLKENGMTITYNESINRMQTIIAK